jgi:undecaprenyl-diphosphatase
LPDQRFRLIEWIGLHQLVVLVGLSLIVGGTWGFAELADKVVEGRTQAFDEWCVRALRDPHDPAKPIGPVWMAEVGRDLTALGGMAVLTLVTLCVAGFLWLDRKRAAMWFVLGAATGGGLLGAVLKAAFVRPRPDIVPHLSQVYTTSFPSGHSMMSAVVYLTLGALLTRLVAEPRLKFYFLAVAALLSGLVGISRVYMGVHYPTDVLAGWTMGLVWATFCWLLASILQRRRIIEEEV